MKLRALLLSAAVVALALSACKSGVAVAPDGSEIDAGLAFLKAMAKSAHKDADESAQAWQELKSLSNDKVPIKVAGQALELDVAGKKSDARLMRFAKVTSLRDGANVRGVRLEDLELRVGKQNHAGRGKVLMEAKGGKWVIAALELE